ncbi:serine hydrolase [Aurantiacibacter poecillastricola]|uniref:serine hydrolase n=1 Tax=Aurantiacibacter poecillastricola TaxID=3064385 RepID=UPI00273FB580|nr:serine hydrolase [Aurantiacibacter sp. 219JJ12-13]MDP5262034.1 serine hydrolase [Aurantiacibacter sp. 219JJ12-13]
MIRRSLAICALLLSPIPAAAQSEGDIERRAEDIETALRGEATYNEVFADSFVNAVPQTQFEAILGQIESQFGPLVGIESVTPVSPNGADIAIRFERGIASGSFVLEATEPFEVAGFVLNDMRPVGDTVEQLQQDLAALPGETSLLVTRLDEAKPIAARNADRQFAIGSTFKLYVLSALARSIAAGERNWHDVVSLTQGSFPGGQLQNWPAGAPVTLHTLASLMISNSDNTATDQLIVELGREAVEAEVVAAGHSDPEATFPFLTTREMFVLKSGDTANLGQYAAAGTPERLAVLQELAELERSDGEVQAAFTGGPVAIDIEWFASANDLASLFRRITALEDETALEILAINPAMPPPMRDEWDYVGYKGGSEPGVLNLTWLLRDMAGEWQAVTLSWNNPEAAVAEPTLNLIAMRAIALAKGS